MIKIVNIPEPLRKKDLDRELEKVVEDNDIVFMGIFGSFVRGEQKKNSDVDVAIRFRPGARKTLLDLVEIESRLGEVFGRKVDLGEVEGLNRHLKDEILNSMKVVYAEG
jgi:hypothetical protein